LKTLFSASTVTLHGLSLTLFGLYWFRCYQSDKFIATTAIVVTLLLTVVVLTKHWLDVLAREPVVAINTHTAAVTRVGNLFGLLYAGLPYYLRMRPTTQYLQSVLDLQLFSDNSQTSMPSNLAVIRTALQDRRLTGVLLACGLGGLFVQLFSEPPSFAAFLASVPPVLALIETGVATLVSGALACLALRFSKSGAGSAQ
jgi:hypothetical protein